MKRILEIRRAVLSRWLVAILLGVASFIPVASADNDAIVQTLGGVSFVSGGVGQDSIERISPLVSNFNLKMIFALNSGDYLSDVRVAIADTKGHIFLDTMSEGPWFLTKLPVGTYQITVTYSGHAIKREIVVGTAKLKTVDFRWATE